MFLSLRAAAAPAAAFLLLAHHAIAQGPAAPPPAPVSVAAAAQGRIVPTAEFKGTVYYKEIAEVANETEGKVVEVLFEEGQHLKKGAPMVRLDSEVLKTDLLAARAARKRAIALLEQERVRLQRVEEMLRSDIATTQDFDDVTFEVEARSQAVEEASAQIARLETILEKKVVTAPFDGVVVRRSVDLGEWKSAGDAVCTFALDIVHDIIVFIPEHYLGATTPGLEIAVQVAGRSLTGNVTDGTPQGDATTRTFPVRVRVTGEPWLLEGMSAAVQLPVGQETDAVMVPRDALLPQGGGTIVYTVDAENKAQPVEVTVVGHQGLNAGVQGAIAPGAPVIVKGHERLRPGALVAPEN